MGTSSAVHRHLNHPSITVLGLLIALVGLISILKDHPLRGAIILVGGLYIAYHSTRSRRRRRP